MHDQWQVREKLTEIQQSACKTKWFSVDGFSTGPQFTQYDVQNKQMKVSENVTVYFDVES